MKLFKEKISKYLAYAFGEFVLIVVGVLVAVAISNWSESNKQEEISDKTLSELKIELGVTLKELISIEKYNQNVIGKLRMYLEDRTYLRTDSAKANFVSELTYYATFEANMPVFYQELSPNHMIINQKVLTDSLRQIGYTINLLKLEQSYMDGFYNNNFVPFLVNIGVTRSLLGLDHNVQRGLKIKSDQIKFSASKLYAKEEFTSIIAQEYNNLFSYNRYINPLIKDLELVISMIDSIEQMKKD